MERISKVRFGHLTMAPFRKYMSLFCCLTLAEGCFSQIFAFSPRFSFMGHLRQTNFELCCVALQLRSDYRLYPNPTTPAAVRTAVSAYACPIWHCGLWLPAVRQARGSPDAALWHQQTAPGIQCSSHNPSRIVVLVCSLTMHCSADVVRRRWADVHLMTSYSHTPGRYGLVWGERFRSIFFFLKKYTEW